MQIMVPVTRENVMVKQHVIVLIIVAGSMWGFLGARSSTDASYAKVLTEISNNGAMLESQHNEFWSKTNQKWAADQAQWAKEATERDKQRAERDRQWAEEAKRRNEANARNKFSAELQKSITESQKSIEESRIKQLEIEARLAYLRTPSYSSVAPLQTHSYYPPTFQAATHAPTEGVVQQPILPTSPTTSNPIIPLKREASDTSSTNISNTDAHIESPLWHNEPPGFFDNQILMLAFAVASTGAFFAAKKTAKTEKDTEIMVGVCGTLAIVFGIAAFRAYCKQAKADSKQS